MPNKKKIGITQLAVTLIILGITIVVDRITGSDWLGRVLDFWPLLLVWIGAEIVWCQSRPRTSEEAGWKLDGKSIAVLVLVLAISGVIHAVNNVTASINKNGLLGLIQHFDVGPSHTVPLQDKDLGLGTAQSLLVENPFGKITIEGSDSNTVYLKAEARINSVDPAAAEEAAKAINIRVTDGKEARIVVEHGTGVRNNIANVHLTVKLPQKMAVSTKSNAGEVEVTGVETANLQSDMGKIKANRIVGVLTARTNAGEIEVTEAGSVDLQTDMGKIEVQDVKEKVSVKTDAGEIDIATKYAVGADWDLRTDMGKISVSIPKDSSVKIQAEAKMGSVKGLQTVSKGPNSSGSDERNGGKYQIRANTDAGAIEFDMD